MGDMGGFDSHPLFEVVYLGIIMQVEGNRLLTISGFFS